MMGYAGALRRMMMLDALRNRGEGIAVTIINDNPDDVGSLVEVRYESWANLTVAEAVAVDFDAEHSRQYRGDDLEAALRAACVGEGVDLAAVDAVPDVDRILDVYRRRLAWDGLSKPVSYDGGAVFQTYELLRLAGEVDRAEAYGDPRLEIETHERLRPALEGAKRPAADLAAILDGSL